jgi:hypothetical protein
MRQQERERHVYDQRRWRDHEWGREGRGEKQTTGAEECETEYDQHGGARCGAGEREERAEARGEAPERERR